MSVDLQRVAAAHTVVPPHWSVRAWRRMRVDAVFVLSTAGCLCTSGCQSVRSPGPGDASPSRISMLLTPDDPAWQRPAPAVSHLRFETTRGVFVLELVR